MQSAQSEQCNHPVMLLQLTFNFDSQCTHVFGCFAVVDNRSALIMQKKHDFQGLHRPSTIVISIPHYSPPLCVAFLAADSFPRLL